MQKANDILSILSDKSIKGKNYTFNRLYRHLFNKDFYLMSCENILDEEFKNTDLTNLVDETIELIKSEKFYPVLNSTDKDVNNIQYRLVIECLRLILESIYEPIFKNNSHGYRQNKNCHTALYQIKRECIDAKWVVTGKINSFYVDKKINDNILKYLEFKIDDGRVIELVRRFLKVGCLDFKRKYSTVSAVLFGPLLINIYLHRLDEYIEELSKIYYEDITNLHEKIRIKYVRYSDEFVITVKSNKKVADSIIGNIYKFIKEDLLLDIDNYKLVDFDKKNITFLGYEILKERFETKSKIKLIVPNKVITQKLKPFLKNNKPIHCSSRIRLSIFDIIRSYNIEIRKLYNYYMLADDVNIKLRKYRFYHYNSLAKTIAAKENSSVKKVISKYGVKCIKKNQSLKKIIGILNNGRYYTYFNEPFLRIYKPISIIKRIWVHT